MKSLSNSRMQGRTKYDTIMKAGNSLYNAQYRLYEVVWNKEKKPDSRRDTVIIPISKGKGSRSDMDNKRNLHTKSEFQKVFGHLVTDAIKPIVVDNLSPFQIGAIPGHRPEEHLFIMKSVLALKEKNNEAIGTSRSVKILR